MRFSLGTGFLYINKHVCKRICPSWLQGRKDWIHAPVEAPCGGGRGVYTCFALRFVCLTLPPPLLFLLSWPSPIAFSPADSNVP